MQRQALVTLKEVCADMSMIRTLSFNGATTLGLPLARSLDPREIIQQEQVNRKSTCPLFVVYIKAQNETGFRNTGKMICQSTRYAWNFRETCLFIHRILTM